MKKKAVLFLLVLELVLELVLGLAVVIPAQASKLDVNGFVNPFIGTGGHGHTYPGATVPFGLVQLSPDTGAKGWDWCSGYHDLDKKILGFSHTHLSGTGCGDLGDIMFLPTVGPVDVGIKGNITNCSSTFSPKDETASPGYYSVKLQRDGGIFVELTATERVGVHRYTFPDADNANIVIDLTHGIADEPIQLQLNFVGDRKVTGLRRSKGWAKNQYVYFAAEFSQPFKAFATTTPETGLQIGRRSASGARVAGYVTFQTKKSQPVICKVALSTTSINGAERNLKSEVAGLTFNEVKAAAETKWRTALSKITIPAAPRDKLEIFYTALYHSMLAPNIISDADGQYRGSDGAVHRDSKNTTYSTFSLWDTFRAEHPLLTIVRPDLVNAFISSMLHQAGDQRGHTLPIWPLYGCETFCMIGYHSFPVISEAYRKGFHDWDAGTAFKYMLENAKRNDYWAASGYLAADEEEQSASRTMEFAYDDAALSQFARDLGDEENYKKFSKRSLNYRNLFDKTTGLTRGRLADGSWHSPFYPTRSKQPNDFTEGNAWQYTFFVPHDVPGLIDQVGGKAALIKKLDELFNQAASSARESVSDVSGVIGQYAHGNEPSHHIAYLYSYAGAPDKTVQWVRQIRDTLYTAKRDGLCGNEDCGQMSAWYVFSALGFYPVNPIAAEYILGVPAFATSTIKLQTGRTLQIIADPKKRFVNKVLLNGRPLNRIFITHKELLGGGTLEFVMSDRAGGRWGINCETAPH